MDDSDGADLEEAPSEHPLARVLDAALLATAALPIVAGLVWIVYTLLR